MLLFYGPVFVIALLEQLRAAFRYRRLTGVGDNIRYNRSVVFTVLYSIVYCIVLYVMLFTDNSIFSSYSLCNSVFSVILLKLK